MAVVVRVNMPPMVDREMLERLSDSMGVRENPPQGLIVHTAIQGEGGLEVIDVWESEEEFRTFERGRLAQGVEAFMREMGAPADAPGLEAQVTEAFDVVRGRS